jgi:D-alanine transaminase
MNVWLNGRLVPRDEAAISVFDRGFLFGDGVYEVLRYFNGVGLDMAGHVRRLRKSLALAKISGFDADELVAIGDMLMRDAGLVDGSLYFQVTRGIAESRAHIPSPSIRATCFAYVTPAPPLCLDA